MLCIRCKSVISSITHVLLCIWLYISRLKAVIVISDFMAAVFKKNQITYFRYSNPSWCLIVCWNNCLHFGNTGGYIYVRYIQYTIHSSSAYFRHSLSLSLALFILQSSFEFFVLHSLDITIKALIFVYVCVFVCAINYFRAKFRWMQPSCNVQTLVYFLQFRKYSWLPSLIFARQRDCTTFALHSDSHMPKVDSRVVACRHYSEYYNTCIVWTIYFYT